MPVQTSRENIPLLIVYFVWKQIRAPSAQMRGLTTWAASGSSCPRSVVGCRLTNQPPPLTWSCRVRYLSWRTLTSRFLTLDLVPFDTPITNTKEASILFAAMAPKKNAREAAQAASATQSTTGSAPSTPAKVAAAKSAPANWDAVIQNIYNHYIKETSQRTKLIDAFLFFLVVVAALQFVYCILVGNYVCCICSVFLGDAVPAC